MLKVLLYNGGMKLAGIYDGLFAEDKTESKNLQLL